MLSKRILIEEENSIFIQYRGEVSEKFEEALRKAKDTFIINIKKIEDMFSDQAGKKVLQVGWFLKKSVDDIVWSNELSFIS